MGVKVVACVLGLLACSNGKPRSPEDAKRVPTPSDAAAALPADAEAVTPPALSSSTGDVQVRIEWKDVPPAARTSPGKTSCGTPRTAAVAPTTTWGIPDALVIVDGAPGVVGEAQVRLADCTLRPRLVIGSTLALDSAMSRPAKVTLSARRQAAALDKTIRAASSRSILLPVVGHEVDTVLDDGTLYELTDVDSKESAWVVAARGAITDPSGVVLVKDVPPGLHVVRAWLPPRGGQPERHARGEVIVETGDLAELTLQLDP